MKAPFAAAVVSTFCFTLLLGGLGASASASAETQTVIIKSYKQPERLLNVQDGAPLAGSAAAQSPAAQWRLESTGEASFIRFLNVGSGLYLQNDGGRPVVGPIAPGSQKADWTLEIVPGHADARIHGRVGGYLHNSAGLLVIGEASPKLDASYWKIVPVGGKDLVTGSPGPRPKAGPKGGGPDASPTGPTDDPSPAGGPTDATDDPGTGDTTSPGPVAAPGSGIPRPPITLPSCPAGQHLSNEHCCPNLQVWNAASHTCTLIPIHYPMCPPGQHLSNGHCCPNLQVWNAASHTCTVVPIHYPVCPTGKHFTNGHCCHRGYVWINGCVARI